MERTEPVSDELVIVGGRYGDLADRLTPLFDEEVPIEEKDIKKVIGGEVVFLTPIPNRHDPYSIGVYTTTRKRIGFLWMYQAYALREWMTEHGVDSVKVRISRVNTKYGFMVSKPVVPLTLEIRERRSLDIDPDWAANLPVVMPSMSVQSLKVGLMLLDDALTDGEAWNECLRAQIDHVVEDLPYDLSAYSYVKGMELYRRMRSSAIAEVRQESDRLLYTMIHRGSEEWMTWWTEHWLPDYFRDVREGSLLRLYEAANYTLEQVEQLLHTAPEHLYHFYRGERRSFAFHLYYSALPQQVYDRFLTLLAVREAMMQDSETGSWNAADIRERISRTVDTLWAENELRHKYDYTWIMMAMNEDEEMPSFDTPTSFLDFMSGCGEMKKKPERSTVSKYYEKAHGVFPNWTFEDADSRETIRRNNVAKRFLKVMKHG